MGLAKYLPEFGWSPTIITPPVKWQPTIISDKLPDLEGVQIIETQYSGFRESIIRAGLALSRTRNHALSQILHLGGAMINYPDSYADWRRFALRAGREVLDNGNVGAIMSICPITSHIVASQLRKEYKLPWICDLPDLWSQNHIYAYGAIRRLLDRRLEMRTLSAADVLVTCSEPRALWLRQLHPGKRVETITLGYDEKEYTDTVIRSGRSYKANTLLTKKFTITYTGLVYDNHWQNLSLLLVALDSLVRQVKINRDDCEVHYYGNWLHSIDEIAHGLGLQDIVHQHGAIPHKEIARIQKESQVLLIIDWDDPNELGTLPGKLFEYLGARRPILSTGGVKGNAVDKLIQETCSGYQVVDVETVEKVLLEWYTEWKKTGKVEYHGVSGERFTQREMTRKYVELLEAEQR